MPRKNRDGKWTTFFIAKSGSDGTVEMREVEPDDPSLESDPDLIGDGAGTLRLENDDQSGSWLLAIRRRTNTLRASFEMLPRLRRST
jgi:hypothetical protein